MICEKIDAQTLDGFVHNHQYANYLKTSAYGFSEKKKHEKILLLGFFEDSSLVASAMIIVKSNIFGKEWYVPGGLCVDFLDEALFKASYQLLGQMAREAKVDFMRVEVDIEHVEHTQDGQVKEDGFNNDFIREHFEALGYHHRGYNYGYSGNIQSRYTIIKDLNHNQTKQDFIDNLHPNHRSRYRKSLRRSVYVEKGDISQLDLLHEFAKGLARTQHFIPKTIHYFESLMKNYRDHAHYFIVYVDLKEAIASVESEILETEQTLEKLDLKKTSNQGRIKELKRTIEYLSEELDDFKQSAQKHDNAMVVGAALYVSSGRRVYNIYSYSNPDQVKLNPAINMHMFAFNYFKDLGMLDYDFVGISGSIDKKDPFYGLYQFKERFNGNFIEYLGEFDYVISPTRYKWYLKWHYFKRRLVRKLTRVYYQKLVSNKQ